NTHVSPYAAHEYVHPLSVTDQPEQPSELYPQDGVTEGGSDWDAAVLLTATSSIVVVRSATRTAMFMRDISGSPCVITGLPWEQGDPLGCRHTASVPSSGRRLRPGRCTVPARGRCPRGVAH